MKRSISPLAVAALCLAFAWQITSGSADESKAPTSQPASAAHKAEDTPTTETARAAVPKVDDRPTTGTPRIIIRWGVETAIDNFGYNVYRTDLEEPENDDWVRMNARILPGVGTTSTPHVFRYLDVNVGHDLDKVWYYRVEELGIDGSRTFFAHPERPGQPMILAGRPKIMNEEEEELFEEGPFVKEEIVR